MNPNFTVLLADDNPDDLTLFRTALRKADVPEIRLQTVCDGEEAIAYLTGGGDFRDRSAYPLPDIVLLDLNMPRVNGFEALQWIRGDANFGLLIVHILTSSSRAADVNRAYELRANSFVTKPGRVSDLIAFIQELSAWHKFISLPGLAQKSNVDGNKYFEADTPGKSF